MIKTYGRERGKKLKCSDDKVLIFWMCWVSSIALKEIEGCSSSRLAFSVCKYSEVRLIVVFLLRKTEIMSWEIV